MKLKMKTLCDEGLWLALGSWRLVVARRWGRQWRCKTWKIGGCFSWVLAAALVQHSQQWWVKVDDGSWQLVGWWVLRGSLFFFFCYVVSGFCDQRRARMMVTGLEGVTGFSDEKLMWIKRVYTDWDWLGLVQDLMR